MLKKDTKRVVVTVEIEIDKDGVEEIHNAFNRGDGVMEYIDGKLGMDMKVCKVLDIQEFDTED